MGRLTLILLIAIVLAACDAEPAGRTTVGLAYTLTAPEGFSLLMDSGKTRNWTPGGQPVAPDEPRIILTRTSKVYPEDDAVRRLAPEQLLRGLTSDLSQLVITATAPVTIDGMPGYETTARAVSARDGGALQVYAASLFAGDGTFHVVAYDGGDDAQANVVMFQEAARSLTVR